MNTRFYLLMKSPNCNADILGGPMLDMSHEDVGGLPVISFDIASQTTFKCGRCGANNYTGDLMDHVLSEGGQDADELDDEDEDADDTEVSA